MCCIPLPTTCFHIFRFNLIIPSYMSRNSSIMVLAMMLSAFRLFVNFDWGQMSPILLSNTLSFGDRPSCQKWIPYDEWWKNHRYFLWGFSPIFIEKLHLTLRSKFKNICHQFYYQTYCHLVIDTHAKNENPMTNDEKITDISSLRFFVIFIGKTIFDLEVKVQGQMSPVLLSNTLSFGDRPSCQKWIPYDKWWKKYRHFT